MTTDHLPLTCTHWGTYRVEVQNNRVEALHPFEEDPDPSPIGSGIVSAMEDKHRIARPMFRKSWLENGPGARPDLRGHEEFIPVEWEEAATLVANELDRIRGEFGNSAIYGGSYGWASAGRFHHAQSQIHRFLNCIGGYTRSVNTYSYAAAEVAVPHILGGYREFVNSATSWDSIADHAELLVAFGGIPLKNGQIDNGGVGAHVQRAGLTTAAEAGVKIVNVGPDKSAVTPEVQSDWIAIRPCTDTALMLALAQEILSHGWIDHGFLERYTIGSGRVFDYLLGRLDGVVKSADWAANICEISADDIRALARDMAHKRTMISTSWSLSRQQFGEQPYWAAITLASMLGGIGRPGTGFAFGYSAMNGIGARYTRLPFASLPQGNNPVDSFIPVARIADMLLQPGTDFRFNGRNYQYPDVRLVYWAGGNPFHHHQDINRMCKAWEKPETIITHDWCWTSSAQYSDIVLPCTNHLERRDIAVSPRSPYVVAMDQTVKPYGEARDDYEIFSLIAEHMGCLSEFTENRTSQDWIEWIYQSSRQRLSRIGMETPAFETLSENGFVKLDMPDRPTIMLEGFANDPIMNPLKTPSGKIEIFSETVAGFDDPDCPGHAAWFEPQEWLGSRPDETWLHLICVQPQNKLHSQLDQGSFSKADKIDGFEPAHISPKDAENLGFTSGDKVEVHNSRGVLLAALVINDDIRPGVVRMNTGAWYDPDEVGRCRGGNPNVLTPDIGTSSLGQGPSAHSCLVQIRLAIH